MREERSRPRKQCVWKPSGRRRLAMLKESQEIRIVGRSGHEEGGGQKREWAQSKWGFVLVGGVISRGKGVTHRAPQPSK